ncbi:right-handed parallel beta-helix repeat-containing protein [Kineococcus rhizosphaerae]|uniref:Parallel beta helix pectate lyase-like protein n=1 Tax=Kineococcus rhizosphaerae TaxID=559628 RepID=A0A2T0R0X2_9ACTN|nr:right-handed parallel beta-helix repeat-containing protein [Kineococcus rhizosphaerae]PRY12956.1 parallel beta helix pectate lyase-like protein [Kineococcus rhizosphaerae]
MPALRPSPPRPLPAPPPAPSPAPLPAFLLAAVLVLLAGCTGGADEPADPHADQRARLARQARALGIPLGFPGPDTTGVPLGTVLQESGSLSATRDGQVVENLDVDGCLSIKADDVVVRNVRIRCSGKERAITIEGARTGIVVEDSEIDGGGSTQVAIGWGGYTLRRVDVHGVNDGPRLGSATTVEDCWIHDMVRKDGFHSDALQSNGGKGIVVRHNTLTPKQTSTGDVLNSAIQLGAENDGGTLSDVTVEDNYLDDGNYSVNVRDDDGVSGIVLRDNVFGTSARYGPVIAPRGKVEVDASNTTRGTTTGVKTVEP